MVRASPPAAGSALEVEPGVLVFSIGCLRGTYLKAPMESGVLDCGFGRDLLGVRVRVVRGESLDGSNRALIAAHDACDGCRSWNRIGGKTHRVPEPQVRIGESQSPRNEGELPQRFETLSERARAAGAEDDAAVCSETWRRAALHAAGLVV